MSALWRGVQTTGMIAAPTPLAVSEATHSAWIP
ncbi:hypothetical protein BJ981_004602 [Sphaerisporangium krabiense]|uniref:Uncharacterized protein n=1 Tax=Sphaerisporangium krabiense TaxID=763782 RepID=A0A7W8Z878_9ACTN|nr:hypothetical protein [Sphaerisporangium krabiense]